VKWNEILQRRYAMKTTTIGIIALFLVVISLSTFGSTHAYFNSGQVTGPHHISTWQSYLWTHTTQADFQAGILIQVNTSTSPGSVILDNQTTVPVIYATTGDLKNFLMYTISSNTWTAREGTPSNVGAGGGSRYTGLGDISVVRGGNTKNFWIYNISSNTWSVKKNIPSNVDTGGTLSDYIGSGNISALRGDRKTTFWIYNISSDTWSVKAPAPANVGAGGALAYIGLGNMSALRGDETKNFWIYNISSNTWSVKTNTPGNVGAGGAITYDTGNYIYAFGGLNTQNFWRYSISGNTWSALADIPGNVGPGGSLVSDNGNYIYAFNGTTTPYFWRYDISSNSWSTTAVANPPLNVDAGGSLTYIAGSSQYKTLGTLASQVYDTGLMGTQWDILQWDSATPAGTNITFEVRGSDTLFAMDDTTPSWTAAGWPSPVSSGLPSGRYLQWRASLLTADASGTPALNEVRVWYS
jgi:hypothetical protein